MRTWVGLLSFLAGSGAAWAQPAATPAELIALADEVEAHSPALARIWPGFWPEGQPFVLYEPGVGAVFGGDAAGARSRFQPGSLADVRFVFQLDYPTGVPDTILLDVEGADDDLATLFHEQFHDFQSAAFRWGGPPGEEFVDLSLVPDLSAFTAAAELERRVLSAALSAQDDAARRDLAATYMALRRERFSGLPDEIGRTEAHMEWSEGTAHYAGLWGRSIVAAGTAANVRELVREGLTSPLAGRPGGYVGGMFRWRAYGVGAALCWLLDELGVEGWRQDVERGQALDRLLEAEVGLAAPDRVEAARLTFDLPRISAEMAPLLAESSEGIASMEAFLARTAARVVVELQVPSTRTREVEMYFHSAGMTPLPENAMALPAVTRLSVAWEDAEISAHDRDVLMEMPGRTPLVGRATFRFTFLFDDLTAFGELPRRIDVASVVVEAEGLRLVLPAGSEIAHSEQEVRIRIAP